MAALTHTIRAVGEQPTLTIILTVRRHAHAKITKLSLQTIRVYGALALAHPFWGIALPPSSADPLPTKRFRRAQRYAGRIEPARHRWFYALIGNALSLWVGPGVFRLRNIVRSSVLRLCVNKLRNVWRLGVFRRWEVFRQVRLRRCICGLRIVRLCINRSRSVWLLGVFRLREVFGRRNILGLERIRFGHGVGVIGEVCVFEARSIGTRSVHSRTAVHDRV